MRVNDALYDSLNPTKPLLEPPHRVIPRILIPGIFEYNARGIRSL
jgi:hypothetical protein